MESVSDRVLIFGIDSFTGQRFAQIWNEKYDVWGCCYDEPNTKKILRCDITDKKQIADVLAKVRPEYIINFAGISFVDSRDIQLIYDVNTFAVEKLLEAIAESGLKIKKLILPSSATVYGNQHSEVLDETMCPAPVNHYGISKLDMEFIARNYFSKLNIIITRPFNYTGPKQQGHFVIPKIIGAFKAKSPFIELGEINVFREFNDIDYICKLYEKLMISDYFGETVNLCSGITHSLSNVIQTMNKICGYEIEVRTDPKLIRKNDLKSLRGSVEKLHKMISNEEPPSIETTLLKMLKEV